MPEIPKGFCQCGCGGKTEIASRNRKDKFCNWIKGEPLKYINGHAGKRNLEGYEIRQGKENHNWKGGRIISNGYPFLLLPNHPKASSKGYVQEHVVIAEKALGKSLPEKTVVHHHTPEQLVVCQDQAYHLLLHKRQRALRVCGNANWRKCVYCKVYDDPANMFVSLNSRKSLYHKACRNNYQRARYKPKGGL